MAGEANERNFGTSLRIIENQELMPYTGRIALHPSKPYVFALNSYSTVYLHRGFTFNTHDTSFTGAWGPDPKVSHCHHY